MSELGEQLWRLSNLYSCRREGIGTSLPFRPRAEQMAVFKHLIDKPTIPLYIVKSRRLGISTAVDTFQADCAAFQQGFRGLIIDKTQADATKKMVEIVRFAMDSLGPNILRGFTFDKRNDSELRLRFEGENESKDSVIYATTGGRGGDCSMLHVSEWGPISAIDPTRSNEIRTGTFPAARKGRRVIETTWYGGKAGDLWDLIKPILENNPNAEGVVMFFPWHSDPEAIRIEGVVTKDVEKYFKDVGNKLSMTFSREQKLWYAAKQHEQGIFVRREYPSTIEEAFSAPVEGSIYGDIIMERRGAGAILPFEWERSYPVFASWDIGWADSTTIWLWQIVGRDIHWIWHTRQEHHTASQMARLIDATTIPVSRHFIPHDGGHRAPGAGKTYKDEMEAAGLLNIQVLPRANDIWPGINGLRNILARSWFRMPFCEVGIMSLESYHTKSTDGGGIVIKDPVHDWSSHDADAARYCAEAIDLKFVEGAAARRISQEPRFPDGSVVDMEHIHQQNMRRRSGLAKSGTSRR